MSDSVTPWTIAHQAPLSSGIPRQEYWSGLSFPPPGDLPDPEIKPESPALAARFFTTSATWEAQERYTKTQKVYCVTDRKGLAISSY